MADEKKPAKPRAPRKKPAVAASAKPVTAARAAEKAAAPVVAAALPASAGPIARRLSPLDGRYAGGPGATLTPLGIRRRFSLRAGGGSLEAVGAALGFDLPTRPKTSATGDGVAALWLGPDEWLLLDERATAEGEDTLSAALAAVAGVSVVDVSHRHVGVVVEGGAAEAIIAAGCPQDLRLRSFPVGAASRTILSKAEIVLWRTGEARFEIECWRSFADYVWTFLEEAAQAPAV